jgi:hypothetical protein
MSPDKQRIAIAEACGWTREYADVQTWNAGLNSYKGGYEPIRTMLFRRMEKCFLAENLPDYLADLNAMHEAETVLAKDQLIEQAEWIGACSNEMHIKAWVILLRATAAQRAEAFLRTVGKWEEDK